MKWHAYKGTIISTIVDNYPFHNPFNAYKGTIISTIVDSECLQQWQQGPIKAQ